MLALAIAGLALGIGGGILSGIGKKKQADAEARKARYEAAKTRAKIPILQEQLKNIEAGKKSATEQYGIAQTGLAIKGLNVAQQGAAALGSAAASAGAGNLGGASPLRRAAAIQRQLDNQMTLVAGEQRGLTLNYEGTMRDLNVRSLATQYDITWAAKDAKFMEQEAKSTESSGWWMLAGDVLGGIGGGLSNFSSAGGMSMFAPKTPQPLDWWKGRA